MSLNSIRWERVSWLLVPASLAIIHILISAIDYPVNFSFSYVALVIAVYLGGFGPGVLGAIAIWGFVLLQIGFANDPGRIMVIMMSTSLMVLFMGLAQRKARLYDQTQQMRLAELNTELAQANKELERKIQDLYHLLRACAHDLRAPLRAIAGFIDEMVLEGRLVPKYIDHVQAGVRQMTLLIDDISHLARLETEHLPSSRVDLAQVIASELDIFRDIIREKSIAVTVGILPTVWGVPTRISQLFQNLIDNALKFNATEVSVNATFAAGEVVIAIRDNGIGIDPKYHTRIFTQFERLNRPEVYSGTGMGLTIVQRIVEQHGGRVWVDSQLGQGATFYVALPDQAGQQ